VSTTFRLSDSANTRVRKLNDLAEALAGESEDKTLYISISGIKDMDPAERLLRIRFRESVIVGEIHADAAIAATGNPVIRILKDEIENGEIVYSGYEGVGTIVDPYYPVESLLEIFPPLMADATLDDISISIPLRVG
jgi:hypothetical protein